MSILHPSTRKRESNFKINRRCLETFESDKSRNVVEKLSISGDKLPVLKKHRLSDVSEDQQPTKRLKTDSEVSPKSVLLKWSESKTDTQVPVQHSGNVIGSEEIPPDKARRTELIKNIFADTIARAQKELGRDTATQNVVKNLSNSGYKPPASASQAKKRLKTDSAISPKPQNVVKNPSVLIKGLEPGGQEITRGISLEKQRQAEQAALDQMKEPFYFENGTETEIDFLKLLGCFPGGKEKKNLLVEDLERRGIKTSHCLV